jgi:CheY-like chemotaxis protein
MASMSANFAPGMTRDGRAHDGRNPGAGSARRGPVSTQMALRSGDVDLDLLSAPAPFSGDGDGYDFDVEGEGDTQPSVLQWLAPEPELMQALVIDPDRESRFYLRAKLAMAGLFLADEAASGGEALYLLKTRRYRVVILDLDLPDMDGWLLAAKVRLGGGPSLAESLVLTRRKLSWLDEIRARRTGANHWLCKPLHPIELAQVLRQVS